MSCFKHKAKGAFDKVVEWDKKMIDKFQLEAKDNNVKIINSCGFDSIPSDMGVYYLQKRFLIDYSQVVCLSIILHIQFTNRFFIP